jgi:hypothetical protein
MNNWLLQLAEAALPFLNASAVGLLIFGFLSIQMTRAGKTWVNLANGFALVAFSVLFAICSSLVFHFGLGNELARGAPPSAIIVIYCVAWPLLMCLVGLSVAARGRMEKAAGNDTDRN